MKRPLDKKQKTEIITDFLNHMESKKVHLMKIENWNNNSIWNKDNPQESHRTLVRVKFDVERLNKSDKELEIAKFLEKHKD